MKKLLLGFSAIALAVAMVPMFAAFEAHVINVTARIENALTVNTTPIEYGTVFPQEKIDKFVDLQLSQSFIDEARVDDIDYVIRQKPKCWSETEKRFGRVTEEGETFVCVDGGDFQILPLLCPYLSKHEVTADGSAVENDSKGINAFHGDIDNWTLATTLQTQVVGHLAKSQQDIADQWKLDLRVPCFVGECAQDWEEFVKTESGNPDIDPSAYVQPKENEHKLFGCDLWLEVTGVSLPGLGCKNADMMLVLDRSGSIDSGELTTMKTAAKAFVDALNPTPAGTHIGQSSFSSTGSLDLHLSDNATAVKTAIDLLVSGGLTNLKEGIEYATAELDNGHAHERPAVPDFMVVLTDGNPNVPGSTEAEAKAFGKAAADAAKAAGVEIFVVGIGSDLDATYLKTIASGDDHYFAASDFTTLEAELAKLSSCQDQ